MPYSSPSFSLHSSSLFISIGWDSNCSNITDENDRSSCPEAHSEVGWEMRHALSWLTLTVTHSFPRVHTLNCSTESTRHHVTHDLAVANGSTARGRIITVTGQPGSDLGADSDSDMNGTMLSSEAVTSCMPALRCFVRACSLSPAPVTKIS